MSNDRGQFSGNRSGGTATADRPDRHGLANLALVFTDLGATLGALALECDQLEGVELSRRVLDAEAELGNTEAGVAATRQYLRDVARAALMR